MPDEAANPNRLTVFTNDMRECPALEAQGWRLSDIIILKFYPKLQPDLLDPKQYLVKYWRPAPQLKQDELL